MDLVHHRTRLLSGFLLLGEKLVGTARRSFHFRCLHHEENQLGMVEEPRHSWSHHHELGGCTHLRTRCRVFRQQLLLPEL